MILRTLIPARGPDLETRARCQDDQHPAGCYSPWLDITVCHCGRVWYEGEQPIVHWPRPATPPRGKPIWGAA